jgi:hypothetical protein
MVRISPFPDTNAETSLMVDAPAPFALLGSDPKKFLVASVMGDICAKGLFVEALISIHSRYCSVSLFESDKGPISAGTRKQGASEGGATSMFPWPSIVIIPVPHSSQVVGFSRSFVSEGFEAVVWPFRVNIFDLNREDKNLALTPSGISSERVLAIPPSCSSTVSPLEKSPVFHLQPYQP